MATSIHAFNSFRIASSGRRRLVAAAVLAATWLSTLQPVFASGPSSNRILNYQIRLTTSTGVPVADGPVNLRLTIYDAASGGTQLYTACATGGSPTAAPQPVVATVFNGTASVLIGSPSLTCGSGSPVPIPATLFNATQLWLGVTVATDAEMTPRKRIVAAGYALNADRLDDLESSATGGTTAFVPVTNAAGLLTLTGNPTTTAAVITANPTAAANELLLDLKNNGTSVFRVDVEGDVTLGGALAVRDDRFTMQDNGDLTKQAVFQLSGITTGTTRTLTVPNASGTLAVSASAPLVLDATTGNLSCPTCAAAASLTLQQAYANDADGGDATITTNATDGDVVIGGDQDFRVTTSIDFTAASLFGAAPLVFEGATADAFETTLGVVNPTADVTINVPNTAGTIAVAGSGPVTVSAAGVVGCATCVVSGGALFGTAGDTGTGSVAQGQTFTLTGGTDISTSVAGQAVTISDTSTLATVTGRGATTTTLVNLNGGVSTTANLTVGGDSVLGDAATDGITLTGEVRNAAAMRFEGATNNNVVTILNVVDPTTPNNTINLPNASGTIAVSASAPLSVDALGNITCATCGATSDSFVTWDTPAGTDPVADGPADTVTFTASNGLSITGDATTDTVALGLTFTGDVTVNASGVTSVGTNAVALGTDTTGNFVSNVTGTGPIVVGGTAGEAWTAAVSCPTCLTSLGNAFVQGGNVFGSPSVLGTNESQSLNFRTNSTNRMIITAAGNVGIGTAAPSGPFHVVGGTSVPLTAGAPITIVGQASSDTSNGGAVNITGGANGAGGGTGGSVNITAGNAGGNNNGNVSGNITLTTPAPSNGTSGSISLTTSNSYLVPGSINLSAGQSAAFGSFGGINLQQAGVTRLSVTNGGDIAIAGNSGLVMSPGTGAFSQTYAPAINTGLTNAHTVTLSTPADTTGINLRQGMVINATIGNATGGTNTANLFRINNLTGDAQVAVNAISVGNITGTAAPENALTLGTGWDNDVYFADTTPMITMADGGTLTFRDDSANDLCSIIDNGSTGTLTCTGGIAGAGVGPNSLDFDDFEDTMDLDAALTLNQGANTWTQVYTGSDGTGFTYESANVSGVGFGINANGLNGGQAFSVSSNSGGLAVGAAVASVNMTGASTGGTMLLLNSNNPLATIPALTIDMDNGTGVRPVFNVVTDESTISGGLADNNKLVITSAGTIQAGNGASGAGNIAYSFVNDNDTGMYRSSANQLRFVTSANDRVTIDSAGRVGIGDVTPEGTLDVDTTTFTAGDFPTISVNNGAQNAASNGTSKYGILINSTGGWLGGTGAATSNYGLYIDQITGADTNYGGYIGNNLGILNTTPAYALTVGTDPQKFMVDSDGHVRVGTSSPDSQTLLAVSGEPAATGDINGVSVFTGPSTAFSSGTRELHGLRSTGVINTTVTGTGAFNNYGVFGYARDNVNVHTTSGSINNYGGYFMAEGNTGGNSTGYGVYATAGGADTNYAGFFNGRVNVDSNYSTANNPIRQLDVGFVDSGNITNATSYLKIGAASQITYSGTHTGTSTNPSIVTAFYGSSTMTGTVSGASSRLYVKGGQFNSTWLGTNTFNTLMGLVGVHGDTGGNLGTTGGTSHTGGWFEATGTADNNYGVFATSSGATVNYGIVANLDTDSPNILGRAAVGYCGFNDYACFSHLDRQPSGNTDYAILQQNDGDTFINAADGHVITFRNANSGTTQMTFEDDALAGIGQLSLELGRIDITMSQGGGLNIRRTENDSTSLVLASFFDNTTTLVGTISTLNGAVSYNAFTGSHYAATGQNLKYGEVVYMTGNNKGDGEVVYGVARTTTANDARVLGAYGSPMEKVDGVAQPHLVLSVGNGPMWVVDNGKDLKPGDYLISADVAGHAMLDPGTYPVAHVVGRVAENVSWEDVTETTEDGRKHKLVSVLYGQFDMPSRKFLATAGTDLGETGDDRPVTYNGSTGDVALSGRFFPADGTGKIQLDKHIFYDGDDGLGGNTMRTDASGWSGKGRGYAEMMPSKQELEPGQMVMLDTNGSNRVIRSVRDSEHPSYLIAGVVTSRPGFIAGMQDEEGGFPVVTSGRVKTRVSTQNGDIRIGDPITSSEVGGVGMRAVGETYVLGIALESFKGEGTGEVMVYVKPGWYNGRGTVAPVDNSASSVVASPQMGAMSSNLNMSAYAITTVGAMSGINELWSIDGDGNFMTRGTVATSVQTDYGDIPLYAPGATDPTVMVAGSSQLENGTVTVKFDDDAMHVLSGGTPMQVLVTVTGSTDAEMLRVTNKTVRGFTVREMNGGTSDVTFDWLVIGRRVGFDDPEEEVPDEEVGGVTTGGGTSKTCSQQGGTWDSKKGECVMHTNKKPTCSEVGGTWDAKGGKCVMPATEKPSCSELGGTWDVIEAECRMPEAEKPTCSQKGGTWDTKTNSCKMQ